MPARKSPVQYLWQPGTLLALSLALCGVASYACLLYTSGVAGQLVVALGVLRVGPGSRHVDLDESVKARVNEIPGKSLICSNYPTVI